MDVRQELTLYTRAARGKWNVPTETKQLAVKLIGQILEDDETDLSLRLKAINTAVSLDKLDLESEKIKISQTKTSDMSTDEILGKLQDLGIDARHLLPN